MNIKHKYGDSIKLNNIHSQWMLSPSAHLLIQDNNCWLIFFPLSDKCRDMPSDVTVTCMKIPIYELIKLMYAKIQSIHVHMYYKWMYGYTNKMSWSRWHRWSTQAGGLTVYRFNLYALFYKEVPLYWLFGRGGTILLVIFERRPHFMGYLNLGGLLLYMEGWSSISS